MPAYVYRLSQWLEKRFNAKGGHVIEELESTARLTLPWHVGVEERYGQGWSVFNASVQSNAVAAQFSRVLLRNPPGSNVVIVVEQLTGIGGVWDYTIENSQPNLANLVAAQLNRLDSRVGFGGPTGILSFDQSATQVPGVANVVMQYQNNVQIIQTVNQEIPVLPNDGLWMVGDVVNQATRFLIRWRERALELSELT